MPEIRSVLDDLFKVPEEEVRTFSEVMRTPVGNVLSEKGEDPFSRMKSGVPDKVSLLAKLTSQTNTFISIESGYDDKDYVWHIEPYKSRLWKVTLDRVIFACMQVLSEVIPKTVQVNVFLPFSDWENQVITFKALALAEVWNVDESDLEGATKKLFEVLRALV